ncbi:MAG: transglutaminase domain-containing protein [Terracidiphilus sp.]
MRRRARGFSFFAAAVFCAAVAVGAGSAAAGAKTLPVPQWGLDAAKTPTPAYAKDAGSVILSDEYLETVDDQGRAVEREREAIRVLQVQGRDTSCETAYDVDEKIDYFREWTIAADGWAFQAKDTDFSEVGDTGVPIELSTERARVVHPPAADVGATIICESEERMAPYDQEKVWWIQSGIPVVYEALEVDLPPGRAHAESWHRYPPVKAVEVAPNHWRWEIHNMRRLDLRDVKAHPDWSALAARMSVDWGDWAVAGTGNQWRALGVWYTNLEAHRADPTPQITAEAQQLASGAPDFYTKLKDITEYIQKNVRYFVVERGIGGWQSHFAAEIFRNQYGDCKDKTALLISMLQAVGIQADYLAVDDRRGVIDPDAPSLYGDHMIAAIEIPANVEDTSLMGPAGADFRSLLKYTDQKQRRDAMETMVDRDLPGATLDSFLFVLPPDLSKAMEIHYKVTAPEYAHTAGPLLLVRPRVVSEDAIEFNDDPRTVPIDLGATGQWRSNFSITLPPGYTVVATPDAVNVDMKFASYSSSSSVKGNVLHYQREYVVRQVQIPAADAGDFRKFEDAIVEDEKEMAVFRK